MTSDNSIKTLVESYKIYPEDFVTWFGKREQFWNSATWGQREANLRHDMVCLLLCNMEPIKQSFNPTEFQELRGHITKKMRTAGSSSASTSSKSVEIDVQMKDEDVVITDEREAFENQEYKFRYMLLEGKPNVGRFQDKLSELYELPIMKKQYDIFDREEKKFIEVKVTLDKEASITEFMAYDDDRRFIAFVHIHPRDATYFHLDKRDKLPGYEKVTKFLFQRQYLMSEVYGIRDVSLNEELDMEPIIFNCDAFENMVKAFTESFWIHRNRAPHPRDARIDHIDHPEMATRAELHDAIEDTSARDCDFMVFNGKILPPPFTNSITTSLDMDNDILIHLLEGIEFESHNPIIDAVNIVVRAFLNIGETFQFIEKKDLKSDEFLPVREALGIGAKGTTKFDNHPDLKQEEFEEKPKARYAKWMSCLIHDLATDSDNDEVYFKNLEDQEIKSQHPVSRVTNAACKAYFYHYSRSKVAEYVSSCKNFYSRMGGAHLTRRMGGSFSQISIFPIYATAEVGNAKVRKVTGFVIKGPSHTKKPTDRVQLITCELMGTSDRSQLYQRFIKKPIFTKDSTGREWCIRQNAVLKHDAPYLKFLNNSTYLCANMIGELCLSNPKKEDEDMVVKIHNFVRTHQTWILQRITESVMMGVLGSSEEEGALAVIRKFYMVNLALCRGIVAMVPDIKGLGKKLNECLISSPLALYFAQQLRMSLE